MFGSIETYHVVGWNVELHTCGVWGMNQDEMLQWSLPYEDLLVSMKPMGVIVWHESGIEECLLSTTLYADDLPSCLQSILDNDENVKF